MPYLREDHRIRIITRSSRTRSYVANGLCPELASSFYIQPLDSQSC